jgi:intracellular multiplication protein IcmL
MADRDQAAERLLANPIFLADLTRRCMNVAFGLIGVCFLFGGYVIWREVQPPPVKYFASKPDFDPIPMTPLDEPVMTNPALVEWAKDAALAAYNLDFLNYRQQSERAKANFLTHAWNGWAGSFIETGNLEKIRKAGIIAYANTHWPAAIRREAVVNGRLTWEVEFPMDLAFVNSYGGTPETRWVTVVVTRTEDPKYPRRLAISQLVDRPWSRPSGWGLGVAQR